MFKKILKNVKKSIMPDIMEMVSRHYDKLKDVISNESKKINEIRASLDTLKQFVVDQQKEINEINKLIKKRIK